jgi:3-deoxy-D-manno-octulosonate 8-phosphate phosphatase (KDO 8-P phosphatase)
MNFDAINVLILDVDGVLTDGRLTYGPDGEITKTFHVQDGFALRCWHRLGHRSAILTGRDSPAVDRRARDLGIAAVRQGVADKLAVYGELQSELQAGDATICFVGDDSPDLGPMRRCAFPVAVANGTGPVKRLARYVTRRAGGDGAVAEVIELILRKQGRWSRELTG